MIDTQVRPQEIDRLAPCGSCESCRMLRNSGEHTSAGDVQIDIANACRFPLCSGRRPKPRNHLRLTDLFREEKRE